MAKGRHMKKIKYPAYGLRSMAKTSVNSAIKAEAHMLPTAAVVVVAFMVQMFGMICKVRWMMETLGIRQYQEKESKIRTIQPTPNSNICLTHHHTVDSLFLQVIKYKLNSHYKLGHSQGYHCRPCIAQIGPHGRPHTSSVMLDTKCNTYMYSTNKK
jgi:hypothetical protein